MRILDNIQLKIQNIHVRYEINLDSDYGDQSGFTLGLKLEQLNVITTNEKWDFQFFDRTVDENKDKPMHKLLSLSSLSLYSDSRKISHMNIVDTFNFSDEKDKNEINYIMKPISANVRLRTSNKFDNKTPKYWVEMIVDNFSLNLKKKELINIIKIVERITQYQKFQDSYNITQKYKFLRPIYSILDERKFDKCKNYNANPNAKVWWKYAIECVLRTIRMKNGSHNQFILSSIAKAKLENQYKALFNRVFSRKQELSERGEGTNGGKIPINSENISPILMELNTIEHNILDEYERGQYDYIFGALDISSLKDWTTIVVKKFHEKEKELESKKVTKQNSIWNVFGWISGGNAEETKETEQADKEHGDEKSEFHISEQEIEEINKLIQSSLEGITDAEREESNLYLEIQYRCIKGELNIEDDSTNNKCGVLFAYSNCCLSMNKKISRELEFNTSMESLTLDMFCQGSHKSNVIYLPLFRTLNNLSQSKISNDKSDELYKHNIYEIKVIRHREGSLVDYEIDVTVEPMYFYYRALLLRIIKSFTSLGASSSEELKLTAWDKFYLAKENTKEKIQSTLLKTTNVLRCDINSPKIILPFSQNNDTKSPAYVLRVGNLKLNVNKENLDEPLYKYMNCSIEGTQLQYFESINLWQKYERDSLRISLKDDKLFNGLNKEVFNVIEELEIGFKIGQRLRNKNQDSEDHAEFIVEGKISDIRINMSAERYNSLINFNKIIEISDQDFASKIMMNEKNDILNNSTKTGFLRKKGDRLQYWNKQFAILSGSYIYFYHEDFDQAEVYESWFYLKDAYVDVYNEEGSDLQNVFYLSNNENPVYLYSSDEESMRSWIKEIRERIFEIKNLTENYEKQSNSNEIRITQQMRTSMLNNPEVKVFEMNLFFEKLEYNMINDNDFSKFLSFAISEMNLNFETTTKADIVYQNERIRSFDRKYSHMIGTEIQKIKVHDCANSIILIESVNKVDLSICILNKNSKHFKGDTFCINVFIDAVNLNFLPESVKKMIMFFRHVDFKDDKAKIVSNKRIPNENLKEEVKEILQTNEEDLDKQFRSTFDGDIFRLTDKSKFKENPNLFFEKSIMKLNLSFKKVNLVLINPSTQKPYIYISVDKLMPVYELKQGYHLLLITCENMPIKIETPLFGCFDLLHMNRDKVPNKDYIPFDLKCEFYKAEMLTPDSKINNKFVVNLDEIVLHYQHENVMRFKDYFFDQFLNAITGDAQLKEPTMKWFSMKNEDIDKINYLEVDLEQQDNFNLIQINISNPMILLRDRPHSADNFAFSIKDMKMSNSIEECRGRWTRFKDKICLESDFNIQCDNVVLSYNTQQLTNIFNMCIDLKTIVNTKIVEEVQSNELEKALHIDIKVKELLKLVLTQHIYTFLLRTMDLNLNFTDSLQHEYVFKNYIDLERLHMNQEEMISMRVNTFIKFLSIEILNEDNSFLAETFYNNANIHYVDKGNKDIQIWCRRYFILEEEVQNRKNIILAPIKCENTIDNSELYTSKAKTKYYSMDISMMQTGDKIINWSLKKVKMFIKPYVFNKLFAFFREAFPDYDFSDDKPNGYYKRNGELASKDPNSKLTFIIDIQESLFLLGSDIRNEKVVICEAHLNFNFHRENYNDCKELLKIQYEKEYQRSKAMNSFVSIDEYQPETYIQMPVGGMTLNLLNAGFRVCKMNNIREKTRKLMTPCNLLYASKSIMELSKEKKFMIDNEQNINVDGTFLKFSLRDIISFQQAISSIMLEITKFTEEKYK